MSPVAPAPPRGCQGFSRGVSSGEPREEVGNVASSSATVPRPRHLYDPRGAHHLVLSVALDQVRFSDAMFDLDRLKDRYPA